MNTNLNRGVTLQTARRSFSKICRVANECGGVVITRRGRLEYLLIKCDAVSDGSRFWHSCKEKADFICYQKC